MGYKLNYRNGTISGAALCEVAEDALGAPMEAFGILAHYLFTVFPLRLMYIELPEYNYAWIASGEGNLFEVQGRLRENDYFDGKILGHVDPGGQEGRGHGCARVPTPRRLDVVGGSET